MATDFGTNNTPAGVPPINGTYYHVCPGDKTIINAQGLQIVGSSGNSGLDALHPLDSIVTAYNKIKDGAGDGIILWSHGTTTAATTSYLTTPLTFAKSGVTVVGMCAATKQSQRARISNLSTSTGLASLITVSGNNNTFLNLAIANFGSAAAALGGTIVSGARNYFGNCNLIGAGNATPAQTAGANSLSLNGADSNTFDNCVIGLDTVDQGGGGGQITGVIQFMGISGGATQNCQDNFFKNCLVLSWYSTSSATSGAILMVGSGDSVDRFQFFENCKFINYKLGDISSSAVATLIVGTVPNNGGVFFDSQCGMAGYAAVGAGSNSRYFGCASAATTTLIAAKQPS